MLKKKKITVHRTDLKGTDTAQRNYYCIIKFPHEIQRTCIQSSNLPLPQPGDKIKI